MCLVRALAKRKRSAIELIPKEIDYTETLVEGPEEAEYIKLRGSPTLLINGKDFEDLPEPKNGNLSCRDYSKGLPDIERIIKEIEKEGE